MNSLPITNNKQIFANNCREMISNDLTFYFVTQIDIMYLCRMEAKSCPATVTVELQLPTQQKVVCVKDKLLQRSTAIAGHHVSVNS